VDIIDPTLAAFLFWSSPVPAWIVDAETDLFLAVNDAAVETYGYTRAEFAAMTTAALCVPDSGQWKNITRDGRVLVVQEVMSDDFFFEGRRARATVSLDISERVQLLDAVDTTRAMLAAAERVAEIGTWSADLRARTVEPSAEFRRLFGPNANEIDTHALFLNHLDDDQPQARATLLRAYETLSPFDMECRLHTTDGVRWYHIGLEYACLDVASRFIGTIRDVNERHAQPPRSARDAEPATPSRARSDSHTLE
jgi:PAS domain-containing protein